jgi:hypothetical protein
MPSKAHLADVAEYALAIVGEMLVQTQPRQQQARERRLVRLQRLAPQIVTVQLDQVEGIKEYAPEYADERACANK